MKNNCVIVINKEKNYTSRDVVNVLNKELQTKKIGHTGTLDPIATGVLVVCVGKYTKLGNYLTCLDKEYIATMRLGVKTDTGDSTGNILEQKEINISQKEVEEVLKSFIKTYEQTVPIYSAVSINGKRLYEYARNNETVKLPKRLVTIYNIQLISYDNTFITFKTKVSKGTYIRSLINDIAESLNTYGTMTDLQRISQGKFTIDKSYTLDDIKNNNYQVLTIKDLFDVDIIEIKDNETLLNKINNGNIINYDSLKQYVLFTYNNEEKALYEIKEGIGKVLIML